MCTSTKCLRMQRQEYFKDFCQHLFNTVWALTTVGKNKEKKYLHNMSNAPGNSRGSEK